MSGDKGDGIEFLGGLLGETESLRGHIGSGDFAAMCGKWAADFAYGTIWSREGLDARTRSAAVMGMLIALRQADELKVHVGIALKNGLTVKEIEEVLYLSVAYAGFPAANTAKQAIKQALREFEFEEKDQ